VLAAMNVQATLIAAGAKDVTLEKCMPIWDTTPVDLTGFYDRTMAEYEAAK
jgi:hypothetical protein